jgi:hypothetical protein
MVNITNEDLNYDKKEIEKAKIITNGNVNLEQINLDIPLSKMNIDLHILKTEELIKKIEELIKQYPNDTDLGREVRKLLNERENENL